MKIVKLEAQNVKRLKAVEIVPEGSTVVIGGRNAQGKSSVLDAIAYALGGKDTMCDVPVRTGESKAKVVCTLDDMIVTRTFTATGGGTLTVSSADGKSKYATPQRMLDALVGKLTFDPLAFARMEPKAQSETLRQLVGLDFAGPDAERRKLYDERTLCGRDVAGRQSQLDAMPEFKDAPAEEVDVSALAEDLRAAEAHNGHGAVLRQSVASEQANVANADAAIAVTKQRVADCECALALARQAQARAEAHAVKVSENLAVAHRESQDFVPTDTAPISSRITNAQQVNRQVQANRARAEFAARFAAAKQQYEDFTRQIETIDQQKAAALAAAKFPVAGLAFTDAGVSLNDLPFAQASEAEKLRVSVGMGLAMNPKLKVLLIRDGSLLDDDSMRMLREMSEAADAQVWIERVGAGSECQVVIEDGQIQGDAQ